MIEQVLVAILSFVALAAVGFAGRSALRHADQRCVRRWLLENTSDYPGRSHATIVTVSSGLRMSEVRVERACLYSKQILRSNTHPELWSVWRAEPESIYDRRGLLVV